ncbi:hypothetical protein Bbelb_258340 [Branchiostoma belcheri]|nr:hypothetical protein Bbelb_258340 [Branchiostoma belcheri]
MKSSGDWKEEGGLGGNWRAKVRGVGGGNRAFSCDDIIRWRGVDLGERTKANKAGQAIPWLNLQGCYVRQNIGRVLEYLAGCEDHQPSVHRVKRADKHKGH